MKKHGKTLIRFEDRYGVATAVQHICMTLHEGEDLEALGYVFENGIGIEGIFKTKLNKFMEYYENGVRRVILVFDLDTDNKSVSQFREPKKIYRNLLSMEQRLFNAGINIKLEYLPVVYSAETVMLYQYYKKLRLYPEMCINSHDTLIMQTSMLRILGRLLSERDVKRCPEYLDTTAFLRVIRAEYSVFNSRLFDVLVSLESECYSSEEMLVVCQNAIELYTTCAREIITVNVDGVILSSDMLVSEMRAAVNE